MLQQTVFKRNIGQKSFGDNLPLPNTIELHSLFLGLQKQMVAELTTNRENILHPGAKGDASELCWIKMLNTYLPKRYEVAKAFVIDVNGQLSEQIDIVIFDRQYSPFLFKQENVCYVPAESVYAVFEVKQDLGKDEIEYAGSKVKSVRTLHRTSSSIPHAGGLFLPRSPFNILAGILTLGAGWNPLFGSSFKSTINQLDKECRIDLGCALQFGAFEIKYKIGSRKEVNIKEQNALLFFFLYLLERLQKLGTVPAIDYTNYSNSIEFKLKEL